MLLLFLAACATLSLPMQDPRVAPLEPVTFERVTLGPGFWAERLAVVSDVTVPLVLERCFETGRVRNFQIAGGLAEGEFVGRLYDDSDVYKALEGVARVLHLERSGSAVEEVGPPADSVVPDAALVQRAKVAALKARAEDVIDAIAAAQCADGYLSTYYQVVHGADEDATKRWTNVAHGHELYCLGHLIEAGVAWKRATGESQLLDVGIRAADHVASVFLGDGKRNEAPGHQELELALFELAQETGEPRFAALATDLLERRGRTEWQGTERKPFGEYCQDHVPIRELDAPVGHAVRLMYQLSAMTDLVRATGDRELLQALERTWQNLVDGHLYVTGGIGAEASNEGFGKPHDLPNDTAYNETCAGIGMVLWNHRMGLLTGEAKYFDLVERALHNNVLAGLSLDGTRFFYVNPLESRGGHQRVPWFDCSCCPTNLARVLPSVGGLVFALKRDEELATICILQAIPASADFDLDGTQFHLEQGGGVLGGGGERWIELRTGKRRSPGRTIQLEVRMPGDSTSVVMEVVDSYDWTEQQHTSHTISGPSVTSYWQALRVPGIGTRRWTFQDLRASTETPSDPWAAAQATSRPDQTTVTVGPFVYCLESSSNGGHVLNLAALGVETTPLTDSSTSANEQADGDARRDSSLTSDVQDKGEPPESTPLNAEAGKERKGGLSANEEGDMGAQGTTANSSEGGQEAGAQRKSDTNQLAAPSDGEESKQPLPNEHSQLENLHLPTHEAPGLRRRPDGELEETTLHYTPYFAWGNRKPGKMVVWLPTDPSLAETPSEPFQASNGALTLTASHCYATDSITSLLDDKEPSASNDHSLPRHTFWDHRGTEEWLRIDLDEPRELSTLAVYWFDDEGAGACRTPATWHLETKQGNDWIRLETTPPGTQKNNWNKVTFTPQTTTSLRLRIQLQNNASAGLLGLRLQN